MDWLQTPFNMLVCGRTGCGKTYLVLDLLETQFKHTFDNIFIFCPTIDFNKTYQDRNIKKNKKIYIAPPKLVQSDLDAALEEAIGQFSSPTEQTLFLIDDCANLKKSKTKNSMLCQQAFSGRHHNISTWVLTQKYNAIVKDFRDNIKHLILHYEKDEDSLKAALKENRVVPSEKRNDVISQLDKGKRLFLRIDAPLSYAIF